MDKFVAAVACTVVALHDDMSEATLTKAIKACSVEAADPPLPKKGGSAPSRTFMLTTC